MSELEPNIEIFGELVAATKYGENPQQINAGIYKVEGGDPLAIHNYELVGGTAPSFNNYADVDRLTLTTTMTAAGIDIHDLKTPFIAGAAKHGNACGFAINESPQQAVKDMLTGNPQAIFGGSVMLNFGVDAETAELLIKYDVNSGNRLLDSVIASEFSEEALDTLSRKGGKLRTLANSALASLDRNSVDTSPRIRPVRGGFMQQDNYKAIDLKSLELELRKQGPEASQQQIADMVLAWAIGSTSNSNTVTLVKNGQLIGNGVGQQDRVSVAKIAVEKAHEMGHDTENATAYSDSFFPFPDGAEVLIDAGVKAILTSSGSVRDDIVFAAFENAGATIYAVRDAKARGFFGH